MRTACGSINGAVGQFELAPSVVLLDRLEVVVKSPVREAYPEVAGGEPACTPNAWLLTELTRSWSCRSPPRLASPAGSCSSGGPAPLRRCGTGRGRAASAPRRRGASRAGPACRPAAVDWAAARTARPSRRRPRQHSDRLPARAVARYRTQAPGERVRQARGLQPDSSSRQNLPRRHVALARGPIRHPAKALTSAGGGQRQADPDAVVASPSCWSACPC
jgi:hypothetical protein